MAGIDCRAHKENQPASLRCSNQLQLRFAIERCAFLGHSYNFGTCPGSELSADRPAQAADTAERFIAQIFACSSGIKSERPGTAEERCHAYEKSRNRAATRF